MDKWLGIAETAAETKVVPSAVPVMDPLAQVWQLLDVTGLTSTSTLVERVSATVATEARSTKLRV